MSFKFNKFIFLFVFILFTISPTQAGGKKKAKAPGEKKYPDLTKGEVWTKPKKGDNGTPGLYNLGPTGLIGWMVGDEKGCQIEVQKVDGKSPAAKKFIVGDLIIGVNGKKFVIGEDMVDLLGQIINDAEVDENSNKITFMVWRDENWSKRNSATDMANVDVDVLIDQVEKDVEGEVYNWLSKDQKKKSEDKFIAGLKGDIKGKFMDITVAIPVLGAYSETSPYDCPKTELMIQRGLKHVREAVKKGKFARYFMRGHALLASGTKEDLELLHTAVRNMRAFKPDRFISSWGWGFGSWYGGYQMVFAAEYYLKTGDKYVLPALTEIATKVAMGQTFGGSWGHSLSGRSFNMGKINMRSSGYGAMNNAGGPCFYGLVMAKKCGISNIHTEAAIARSIRFYGAISELGATPYGMHPVAGYEDSNGKNGPPAFAFKMLGHKTHAQYFAWCESVAANWKHGGHCGGEWASMWRTFGAVLGGPLSVKAYLKNRRNYYAMFRRYDGSWAFHCNAGLYGFSSSNAVFVLRYIGHKNRTYLTGKDPMKEIQLNEETMQDVYDANGGNSDRAATVAAFSDTQLLDKLRTFSIKMKRAYAAEVGKRYKAGNKAILNKVLPLLKDEEPRRRSAAVLAIAECGEAETEKNLDAMLALFDDPRQFVRIHAIEALSKHFENLQDKLVEPMMKLVTRKEYWEMLNDNNNVPTHVFNNLFRGRNKHTPKDAKLCTLGEDPFNYGTDETLTRETMERAMQWDPGRAKTLAKVSKWNKEQVIDMIGPIVFGAEFLQHNDMMFAGGGLNGGRSVLSKHNMKRELIDAASFHLYLLDNMPRTYYAKANGHGRAMGGRTPYDPEIIKRAKGAARHLLPFLQRYLVRNPLKVLSLKDSYGKVTTYRMYDALLAMVNDTETPTPESIATKVDENFKETISQLSGKEIIVKHCRQWLNPSRKTFFRQMSAMSELVRQLGSEAIVDLIPYLTHDQWRWRKHSRALIKEMGSDATEVLNQLYSTTKNDTLASGLIICMLERADKDSTKTVLEAFKNGGDKVKVQAVQALVKLTGIKHLSMITDSMRTISTDVVLDGFERALLMCKGNESQEKLVSKSIIGIIKKSKRVTRASIYYIMAMIGGETNLSILKKVSKTKSEIDFENVMTAMSHSRDPKATQWIADMILSYKGEKRSHVATKIGLRRMVLSANEEIAHVDNEAAFKYAKQVLEVVRSPSLLRLLGRVCIPKSGELLFDYMKKGPEEVTLAASDGITDMGGYMSIDAPEDDRKRVTEILGQVVEFITVTKLRVDEDNKDPAYFMAKKKCDIAGKNMLRLYDPAEAEIEDADDDDLDI